MHVTWRMARFWDLLYNSGNFNGSVRLLWTDQDVYAGFLRFSKWIYGATESTWQIALKRLAELFFTYLTEELGLAKMEAEAGCGGCPGQGPPKLLHRPRKVESPLLPDTHRFSNGPRRFNKRCLAQSDSRRPPVYTMY